MDIKTLLMVIVMLIGFAICVFGLSYLIVIQHNTYMKKHPEEFMEADDDDN